jgi:diacylglycerol kinase
MKEEKFSILKRLKSFSYAFSGILILFRKEHNPLIYLGVLIIVIAAGIILEISPVDWILLTIVSGMVFASECFNTSIEYLSDNVSPERNNTIEKVKDLAAAGVLVSAITSAVTGVLIFLPRLVFLFK